MSTDVIQQLAHIAPAPEDLEVRWPAAQRAELSSRILSGAIGGDSRLRHLPSPRIRRGPRTRRRRLLTATSLAAAVTVTALAVPALLPHDVPGALSPAAAALDHLADVAARTPADRLAPGQFVHTVTRSLQVGVPENPELGAVESRIRMETWTAYDGRSWTRSTRADGTGTSTLLQKAYPQSGADYFASLPTDPDQLGRYLRTHTHGSSSKDEAVFLAVGDLMSNDTAPAALRSAAATALSQTDHVRLGSRTTDASGRAVTEFDFVDEAIRPGQVQAFLVDPDTAQVIGRRQTQPGSSYEATTISSEVVDAVPGAVVRQACPVNGPIC